MKLQEMLTEYMQEILFNLPDNQKDSFYSFTKTGELVAVVNIIQWLKENE